jgi:hypothetical protein
MFRDPELPKTLFPSYRRFKEIKPLVTPRRIVATNHEGNERREGEPRIFPTCGQHDGGVTRIKMSEVGEMRVSERRTQFRQKFWQQNDVFCLRDQTSKVHVSVWLISCGALQVDEIRNCSV